MLVLASAAQDSEARLFGMEEDDASATAPACFPAPGCAEGGRSRERWWSAARRPVAEVGEGADGEGSVGLGSVEGCQAKRAGGWNA